MAVVMGKSNPMLAFVVDNHTMCCACAEKGAKEFDCYHLFFSVVRYVKVHHNMKCPSCDSLMGSHDAMHAMARICKELESKAREDRLATEATEKRDPRIRENSETKQVVLIFDRYGVRQTRTYATVAEAAYSALHDIEHEQSQPVEIREGDRVVWALPPGPDCDEEGLIRLLGEREVSTDDTD